MARNDSINLVFGPIDVAAKVHRDQQERIINFITGPKEASERSSHAKPLITNFSLDEFLNDPEIVMLTNR